MNISLCLLYKIWLLGYNDISNSPFSCSTWLDVRGAGQFNLFSPTPSLFVTSLCTWMVLGSYCLSPGTQVRVQSVWMTHWCLGLSTNLRSWPPLLLPLFMSCLHCLLPLSPLCVLCLHHLPAALPEAVGHPWPSLFHVIISNIQSILHFCWDYACGILS